jgi:hypothetical protein
MAASWAPELDRTVLSCVLSPSLKGFNHVEHDDLMQTWRRKSIVAAPKAAMQP